MPTNQKIVQYLSKCFTAGPESKLTFGVEQEFFLYEGRRAASHEASQAFFNETSRSLAGKLTSSQDTGIGHHVSACKFLVNGSPVRLKYEHHPHLLELEFEPMCRIGDFEPVVRGALSAIVAVAEELNQQVEFCPFLRSEVPDEQVKSDHSLCRSLREYRRAINASRPNVLNAPELINFSAYIASTHTHFGGIPFAKLASVIHLLYQLEPETMQFAWQQVAGEDQDPGRRFRGFLETASNLPLVGFPDLESWNVEAWAAALLEMPVAEIENECDSLDSIGSLFKRKRDLSIIQPREYGTIEFRGDPCLPSADALLGVLAIRVGLVCFALDEPKAIQFPRDLKDARNRWLSGQQKDELNSEIIRMARQGLLIGDESGERYLEVFA